jgi:4-aminobutyrate aminotransferase/(S)-3-amino-2-methylpropionate transaminase
VADEVWPGLGRSGEWLLSLAQGAAPDLVCLGKGLGGGLPISACFGRT